MVSATPDQKIAVQIPGAMLPAPAAITISPPTGDATPQTHMHAYLTG